MRSLILNERMIEFAMEGKRYWDLRRTRNYGLITARQSYKLAAKSPYVAGNLPTNPDATKIYIDVPYVSGVPNPVGVRPRDTANLNNQAVYTAIYTPAAATLEGSNTISIPAKYYFYALPNFSARTPSP